MSEQKPSKQSESSDNLLSEDEQPIRPVPTRFARRGSPNQAVMSRLTMSATKQRGNVRKAIPEMSAFFIVEANGDSRHFVTLSAALAEFLRLLNEGMTEDIALRFSS